jgi:hypothetical protein
VKRFPPCQRPGISSTSASDTIRRFVERMSVSPVGSGLGERHSDVFVVVRSSAEIVGVAARAEGSTPVESAPNTATAVSAALRVGDRW